ncbi:hypothetical protein TNCV_720291 [Trichonephila clavipes]|nr:hypothetical protein TNCV_720291 [Trichonephila clavipes]
MIKVRSLTSLWEMERRVFLHPISKSISGVMMDRHGLKESFLIGGVDGAKGFGYRDCFGDIRVEKNFPIIDNDVLEMCFSSDRKEIKAEKLSCFEIALFCYCDEAHFWLNGYVNKQNCRIWSEANPQVYVETPLHPEKLTVWCALWAGGILLQKR